MKMRMTYIWKLLFGASVILATAIIGCGGGSSGTGGQQYQGTVLSRASQPLPGVRVTITQSGDSTVTDANGYYSVVTDAAGGSVTYIFEAPGLQIQFTLEGVSANASVVTVNFVLDEQEQSADPSFVDIQEDTGSNNDGDNSSGSSDDDNDNDNGSSSSQGSAGSSSSIGSSTSDDDHGSGSSEDGSGSSSSDDGISSSSSSESSDDDSSSSSQSSESSSSSSDDHGGGSGSGSGSGSGGSGSGGSSGSSSSDDD